VTDVFSVGSGDAIQLWCYGQNGDGQSYVFQSFLTTTLINSANNGVKKAHHMQAAPPLKLQ